MDWEDRKKKTNLNDFYLDVPEEKIYYPIDLLWKYKDGESFSFEDNWIVNLEDGKVKDLPIKEINLKRKKPNGR